MKKLHQKKPHLGLIVGSTLLIAGLLLFFVPAAIRTANAGQIAQPVVAPEDATPNIIPVAPDVIQGKPISLDIPSVNISVPIIDGVFNAKTQTWTLTLNKAQYAVMTVQPNNKSGNTFIYGHNRREVFNRLPKIKAGAIATIKTDNGHIFTYTFRDSRVTNPSDVSLFEYEGKPILTLQTCTGLFYQNRQLFTFDLTEAV